MTTLVDLALDSPTASPARKLQCSTAAVRLSFTWFGCRRSLTPAQKAEAAETFGAEGQFLSAGKKLVDTRHPAFRKVTAVRGRAVGFWRLLTLPYPESGIRLIRQDRIEEFDRELNSFRRELDAAVAELDDRYGELQTAARRRLGSLFNPADYPASLRPWFKIDWDFPSVEPPDYLMDLHPRLYEQEKARIAARFEEAVGLAEQAFVQEFRELVGHLCERIGGSDQKVFRNSAIGNLSEFFERFRSLNVRSNAELDQLVAQAQNVVRGVDPQDLRDDRQLRQLVSEQLAPVQTALDAMLVDRPRRRILRGAT